MARLIRTLRCYAALVALELAGRHDRAGRRAAGNRMLRLAARIAPSEYATALIVLALEIEQGWLERDLDRELAEILAPGERGGE